MSAADEIVLIGRVLLASASLNNRQTQTADTAIISPDTLFNAFGGAEKCPACGDEVLLEDIRRAKCKSGHEWGELSLAVPLLSDADDLEIGRAHV